MRSEFISFDDAATKEDAEKIATYAAIIIEVCGGWHAFESMTDYEIWQNQK